MELGITFADIVKSVIFASINGISVFLSVRYMGKMVDKLDSRRDCSSRNNGGDKK